MPKPQNFKSHTRWRPLFHFTIIPLLLLNLIFSIVLLVHHHAEHPHVTVWWVVLSVILILVAADHRNSALGVQDRVIRLE